MGFVRVMAIGLSFLCSVALGQQHAPIAEKNPLSGNVAAAEAGKHLYVNYCQVCHGGDGTGGRGPTLATRNLRHGTEDWQLFQTIREGIPGTQMPDFDLASEQIWQIVTYLKALTPSGKEEAILGDPSKGETIFFGKGGCQVCHQVNGRGGRVGPDLSTAGQWTIQALREAILRPNEQEGRRPNVVSVTTNDGKKLRGVIKNEDSFSLQMMDSNDEYHLLEKQSLKEVRYDEKSLMPEDYQKQLSVEQIQDLLAFLKTLRVRNLKQVAENSALGLGLTYERIRHSRKEPHNWLTYWGDYQGRHYSPLKDINVTNVKKLQARWAFQFTGNGVLQATPLVEDGIMYTTGASGYVYALDARTGNQLWQYQHKVKSSHPNANATANRGVAKLGERLFFVTADAGLSALDAKTGRLLWNTILEDVEKGYYGTMTPLALRDRIIVGISGGEFGARGFIDAYDPISGGRLWRFYTIPGPGEYGNDTWAGDSWKTGGGTTWTTGTYDSDLDILYWPVGNAAPDLDGDSRLGDNLFTSSVVALDPSTGKRKWHFQFTPHDTHDWDSNETPVLVDQLFGGQKRQLLLHADRNAFFYVLDRTTGEFLLGRPFARQTWAKGLTSKGRPILVAESESSLRGQLLYPSMAGATNWQAPSYDPISERLYIALREAGDTYYKEPQKFEPGKPYWGGKTKSASEKEWAGIKSIDPQTGKSDWEFKLISGSLSAGVLATAGGIVLAGSQEGNLIALDSGTGRFLWRFQVGAAINSSPMSYAIEGQQFIALSAGKVLYAFALPQEETKQLSPVSQSRIKSKARVPPSPKLLGVEIGPRAQ